MLKKTIYIFFIIIALITVSGCAFGTRRPILKYEPGSIPQAAKNINLYVENIKDERVEKDVIGHVRNGYGMKTAKIITETNIAHWISEGLKSELSTIGYNIVTDPNSKIKISGEVIEVYVTSLMMYEGKTVVEIALNIDGKEIFSRKYKGSDESLNWAATAKSYGLTLEKSLQKTLIEAANDIDRAIEKKT